MHLLKIALLLGLTLAAMRLSSWALVWLLGWVLRSDSLSTRFASNLLALLVFAGLLVVDSVPGEVLDLQALAFGVVVFGALFAIDTRWLPGCLLRSIQRRRDAQPARRAGLARSGGGVAANATEQREESR